MQQGKALEPDVCWPFPYALGVHGRADRLQVIVKQEVLPVALAFFAEPDLAVRLAEAYRYVTDAVDAEQRVRVGGLKSASRGLSQRSAQSVSAEMWISLTRWNSRRRATVSSSRKAALRCAMAASSSFVGRVPERPRTSKSKPSSPRAPECAGRWPPV